MVRVSKRQGRRKIKDGSGVGGGETREMRNTFSAFNRAGSGPKVDAGGVRSLKPGNSRRRQTTKKLGGRAIDEQEENDKIKSQKKPSCNQQSPSLFEFHVC